MKKRFPNRDNPVGFLEFEGGYLQALWTVVNHPYQAM